MGTVKHIALKISLATFFAMTVLGLVVGLPTQKIAMRAVLGAAVAFVASFIALRMAISVMVQAVIDSDDSIVAVDVDEDEAEKTGEGESGAAGETSENTDKQLATQE
jgi:hypothetical protein